MQSRNVQQNFRKLTQKVKFDQVCWVVTEYTEIMLYVSTLGFDQVDESKEFDKSAKY